MEEKNDEDYILYENKNTFISNLPSSEYEYNYTKGFLNDLSYNFKYDKENNTFICCKDIVFKFHSISNSIIMCKFNKDIYYLNNNSNNTNKYLYLGPILIRYIDNCYSMIIYVTFTPIIENETIIDYANNVNCKVKKIF